jgi:hypothetical protein
MTSATACTREIELRFIHLFKINAHTESLREIVTPIAELSTRSIAKTFNDRGIATSLGDQWQSPQAIRLAQSARPVTGGLKAWA